MRVLNVIDSLDPSIGGTVTSVLQSVSLLEERGHEAEIASLADDPADSWIREIGAKVRCFGPARLRYAFAPRYRRWLRERAHDYDLVLVRGLWQYQGFATFAELHRLGRPYAVFVHGMLGPYARAQRQKYVKKWVYWHAIERRILRCAVAAVFTSDEEARLARDFFPGSEWHPAILGDCADPPPEPSTADLSDMAARFPELARDRVVLSLGRLHPIKGTDNLMRSFAEVFATRPGTRLVLAGPAVDPQYERFLHNLAMELGIAQRITWTGLVPAGLRSALLSRASLFVSASHHENFGFSIVEALAFGVPVVLTDKVNIHPLLVAARAAIVCADTVAGIAEALREWLAMDDAAIVALRERQRDAWRQHFSRPVVGARMERMFTQFAATRS